jgi:hypothetical protein
VTEDTLDELLAETPPGVDGEPGRVTVTSHAALMWLERIDPAEPLPEERIRRAWRDSEPVPSLSARVSPEGVHLVYDVCDGSTVKILTVYR